jgi:hypothetical protein
MTTAAVVAYYSRESEAIVSYAGHPPVAYKRTTDRAWSFARPLVRYVQNDGPPMNIPLAVAPDTLYGQLTIPLAPGDRLFVYTSLVMLASKMFLMQIRMPLFLNSNRQSSERCINIRKKG